MPSQKNPSGQWESDETVSSTHSGQTLGSVLKPVSDVSRTAFGSLWEARRNRPLILVSLIAVIGVCVLACGILILVFLTNQPNIPPIDNVINPQPTVAVTNSLVVDVNMTPIAPSVPNRLTIGNTAYNVVPTQPTRKGDWPYDRNAQKTVYWVAGTLVNYVLGLPATDANRAAFNRLQLNELIVLDTAVGTLHYRVTHTQTVKLEEQAPLLAQSIPQLTLVLLGESGDQRRLLVAQYTDEAASNSLTPVGVPIYLGDVRVEAESARLIPGQSAGLAPDRNVFQVNIMVTSLVTRLLDAGQFTSVLIDPAGNRYPLSTQGSLALGAAGWTQGVLAPGATLSATAGFEVPANLPAAKLEWAFSIEQTNPYLARVSIPYQPIVVLPTVAPTKAPVADVQLLNVNISPEGTELRVVGTVHNLTDKVLSVSLRDFSVTSGNAGIALNSSLPALPWSITSGQTLAFQFTFARPPGGSPAVFTFFGQSFEISGL